MRARTALIASNALATGVKYTHLHTVGVWWKRVPILFPVFFIDRAEHLEILLRTVVLCSSIEMLRTVVLCSSIEMQLSNATDTAHLLMNNTTGTLF